LADVVDLKRHACTVDAEDDPRQKDYDRHPRQHGPDKEWPILATKDSHRSSRRVHDTSIGADAANM
jgi:hypothetical protein